MTTEELREVFSICRRICKYCHPGYDIDKNIEDRCHCPSDNTPDICNMRACPFLCGFIDRHKQEIEAAIQQEQRHSFEVQLTIDADDVFVGSCCKFDVYMKGKRKI